MFSVEYEIDFYTFLPFFSYADHSLVYLYAFLFFFLSLLQIGISDKRYKRSQVPYYLRCSQKKKKTRS